MSPEKTDVNTIFVFDPGGYQVPAPTPRVAVVIPEVLCKTPRPSNGGASPHHCQCLNLYEYRSSQLLSSGGNHLQQLHCAVQSLGVAVRVRSESGQGIVDGRKFMFPMDSGNGLTNVGLVKKTTTKFLYFGPLDYFYYFFKTLMVFIRPVMFAALSTCRYYMRLY